MPALVSRPSISIFTPEGENASEQGLTLSKAFKRYRLPMMAARSPDTIGEYETHIRRWEEFWRAVATGWRSKTGLELQRRIIHPALSEVSRTDLLAWREWLAEHPKEFSNRNINKHLGSLQAIADSAIEEGAIQAFPRLAPLEAAAAGRKIHLAYEEADRLKRACAVATWPTGLLHPPGLYWETLVVGFCVYGFRTQEQVKYEQGPRSLDWSDIRLQAETPHPDGKAVHPLGWLVYTPQKQKRLKPEPLVLPIVEAYRVHLDAIRPPKAEGMVFPFPAHSVEFYDQWGRIREAAGIRPKPNLDGSQPEYNICDLRKTAATWLNNHGATIGSPAIGDRITGHAADRSPDKQLQSRVSATHYDFAEDRVLRALTTLPLPSSFAQPLHLRKGRQMTLFG